MKITKAASNSQPDNYEVNEKICRLVRRYPCMYDRSFPHYLKKDVVDKAWVKIAQEMDDSIPSCKERWRNIRTSFARSINVHRIPASANRTKPYYLHAQLQFLARHITPGVPISRRSNASNVSYFSAGDAMADVSAGGESFDGFASIIKDNEDDDDDDDEEEAEADEEEDGSEQTAAEEENESNVSSLDESNTRGQRPKPKAKSRPKQQDQEEKFAQHQQQLQKQQEQEQHIPAFPDTEAAVEASLPQIMPPKKRQRTELLLSSASSLADLEPENEMKPIEASAEVDFDANFLQGLLPEMKAMNFRQKLLFKRRIYEVISEVFESNPKSPTTAVSSNHPFISLPHHHVANPNRIVTAHLVNPPTAAMAAAATHTTPATMTVVSAAELAMIRRLNSLLQNPTAAIATLSNGSAGANGIAAVSASTPNLVGAKTLTTFVNSSSATATPVTATVTVHRGALARAGNTTNLLRVTMVNPPAATKLATTAAATTTTTVTATTTTPMPTAAATHAAAVAPPITTTTTSMVSTNGSDKQHVVKQEPLTVDD